MLALLPAAATVIGLVVLGQVPTMRDLTGIGLVILGVALHRDPPRGKDQRGVGSSVHAGGAAARSRSAAAGNLSRELSTRRGAPSSASRAPGA